MDQHGPTPDPADNPYVTSVPPLSADLSAPEVVEAAPRRRSRVGTGVALAAVAVGAIGLGGVAYAATSSSSPSPSPSSGSRPGYGTPDAPGQDGGAGQRPGGMMGRHGGPGGLLGGLGLGLGDALHGSVVTAKQGGGYQTLDGQRGTVTAVSATSITVRSADGFTATYVVTADTLVNAQRDGIASVRTGDTVGVMAVEAAGSKDAVAIVDQTRLKAGWQQWMPDHDGDGPNGPNGPNGQGAPNGAGTGSSSGTA